MAGRPTDYSEEMVANALEYASSWKELNPDDQLPTLEGLAMHLGISRETIYDWEGQEGKEQFSDIVVKIRLAQAKTLINKGLKGDFNAPITKVMLTKHGYREGIDTTSNDKTIEPSPEHKALADAALSHLLNGHKGTPRQEG